MLYQEQTHSYCFCWIYKVSQCHINSDLFTDRLAQSSAPVGDISLCSKRWLTWKLMTIKPVENLCLKALMEHLYHKPPLIAQGSSWKGYENSSNTLTPGKNGEHNVSRHYRTAAEGAKIHQGLETSKQASPRHSRNETNEVTDTMVAECTRLHS